MNQLCNQFPRTISALLGMLLLSTSLPAVEILSFLPGDTLGFALVRNVQSTNDKVMRFVSVFREGLPAPLEMAKAMTGLSAGLNLEGDLLFALLPTGDKAALPAPMFLLPVSDYTVFAAAMKADATGEICRITMANEDVLIAKRGPYALVMNLEHRDLMQQVLAQNEEIPSTVSEHQDWLAANDISLLVTSAGIAYEAEANKLRQENPEATTGGEESVVVKNMLDVGDELPFSEFFTEQIKTAGLGLTIDDAINARLRWQVHFQAPLSDAKLADVDERKKPLTGYAVKPYVLAGGGPLPLGTSTWLPELFTALSREFADQDGRGDFTEKDWSEVRESCELATAGLRSISYLVTPGREGEPLLSILSARLTVDDSANYVASLQKLFELANRLSERSNSDIKLLYKVAPATIAGVKGIEVSCDLDKATGDEDRHIWQAILTSVFGIDHVLSMYFCATDEHQVFFGMESSEKLAEFIENFRKGETGLVHDAQVQKTLKLANTDAARISLLNPEGLVELVKTAMKSMMVLGVFPEVPDYPAAPPLALTMNGSDTSWDGEVVLPVAAARAMAQFSKEVEKMFAQ